MKVYETSSCDDANRLINDYTEDHIIVFTALDNSVFTGQFATFDKTECNQLGFDIGVGQYHGGSIVNMVGDITVGVVSWGHSELVTEILEEVFMWLEGHSYNVVMDDNDLLLDDKKVASWARATLISGWSQSYVHFSIGPMDLSLVEAICTKPMTKIPGSLSDYGLTKEFILNIINPIIQEATLT